MRRNGITLRKVSQFAAEMVKDPARSEILSQALK